MTSNDKINSLEETLFLVDNFEFLKKEISFSNSGQNNTHN